MAKSKIRVFRLFDDEVVVSYSYDKEHGISLGEYPDFSETPRLTPCGRPWVNVTFEDCTLANNEFGDCGSCQHFFAEKAGDLIGVCTHEQNRVHRRE